MPLKFRLLFGGGRHSGADGFVSPPAAVPRHARPPERLGYREDEPEAERQRTLRKEKALHSFVPDEPWSVEKALGLVRPSGSRYNFSSSRTLAPHLQQINICLCTPKGTNYGDSAFLWWMHCHRSSVGSQT